MIVGCARSRVQYREVFQDARIHVRLAETRDKSGVAVPRGYDHPWDVDVEFLDDLLASVHYKKGKVLIGGGQSREAFPAVSRHALLKPLQRAFAEAGPNEAVDFAFVEERSTLKVFRRVFFTDGILFRKGGELNVAFRNLAFEQIAGEEEERYEPNREDPLESPMRTSWILEPGEGQTLAAGEGIGLFASDTYTNWIKLDLSRRWGVLDAGGIEKAMPGVVDSFDSALPEPVAPSREEIQERLRFLEELRREGTITERDYLEKKRELERLYDRPPQ